MSPILIVLGFVVIAAMRVIQKMCAKKVSGAVSGATFFHYGGYYNLVAALLALISVALSGFAGFTLPTLLCAAATAVFLALELLVSLTVLKTCSLIVVQMFAVGAMAIPCIVGIFFFGEPMSLLQWLGVALFMGSMYLIIRPASDKRKATAGEPLSPRTLLLLVLLLLLGGGVMVVQKAFSRLVTDGSSTAYSFLMFAFSAAFMYTAYLVLVLRSRRAAEGEDAPPTEPRALPRLLLVCGALLAFAVFVINLVVVEMGGSVSSALLFSVSNVITIVITILVGYFYYRERISPINGLGILTAAGAIAMINFL